MSKTIDDMRQELEADPVKARQARVALAIAGNWPMPKVPTRDEVRAAGYSDEAVDKIIAEQVLLVAEWNRQKAELAAQAELPNRKPAGWNRDGGNV